MNPPTGPGAARAMWSFWILLILAVLAAGSLSAALAARPSPTTGLRVVGSGLVLVVSVALAGRIVVAVDRARRHTHVPDDAHRPPRQPSDGRPGSAPTDRAT